MMWASVLSSLGALAVSARPSVWLSFRWIEKKGLRIV
jgi:hypothetical protein